MTAAERQLPSPSTTLSWIDLAKKVFELQVARWDTETCGGGLRWQIFPFNQGYGYKNAEAAGGFFQLAARLARYTGNQTYADWAQKTWDWTTSAGFVTSDYQVFDGADVSNNCSDINKLQWSQNAGAFLYGSAAMYNFVSQRVPVSTLCPGSTDTLQTYGNTQWQNRTESILSSMSVFFSKPTSIMTEVACETKATCESEQYAFKGLTAQWMGTTTQIAPFTRSTIMGYLQASAKGAADQCTKQGNVTVCGFEWNKSSSNGITGVGQQLSALNVIVANLAINASAPVTVNTTTTSQSTNPGSSGSAGPNGSSGHNSAPAKSISPTLLAPYTNILVVSIVVAALSSI